MKLVLVMLLMGGLSGCSLLDSSVLNTTGKSDDSVSRYPWLDKRLSARGQVPLYRLVDLLTEAEVLREYPPIHNYNQAAVPIDGTMRVRDVVVLVERSQGWVFDPATQSFYECAATHSMDSPDLFGRVGSGVDRVSLNRRSMVAVRFRFVQAGGSLDVTQLGLSANYVEFNASVPEGVQGEWHSDEQRSYQEGITNLGASNTSTIATTQQSVSAGVDFTGLAARLPGSGFRIDGHLSVSSFTDAGFDRAVVSIPVQVDGERGRWVRTYFTRGANGSASLAFKSLHMNLSASASAVALLVRVD